MRNSPKPALTDGFGFSGTGSVWIWPARPCPPLTQAPAKGEDQGGLKGTYLRLDRTLEEHKTELGFTLLILFAAITALAWRRELVGILIFIAAASLLYIAAIALFPLMFFPIRFFQLVMPIATALLFAWGGRQALTWLRPTLPNLMQTSLLMCAVALIFIATGSAAMACRQQLFFDGTGCL